MAIESASGLARHPARHPERWLAQRWLTGYHQVKVAALEGKLPRYRSSGDDFAILNEGSGGSLKICAAAVRLSAIE
ncbi:MAG: hypothetical protein F6J97_03930 [Leptolyngbya sp. SIO4C1]|nr:hypothetical protein [Leptolyngbya sp. SIO4C1]